MLQGAVAQLGERLVCNQEATGSIPVSSTNVFVRQERKLADLIEFAKYFAEFVFAVVLILLLAYWPPKNRGFFGQRRDKGETQTLFGKDHWWQP